MRLYSFVFNRFRNTSIGLHSALWTSPLRQGYIPHGAPQSQTIHQTRPAPRLQRSRKVSRTCISSSLSSARCHGRPRISHLRLNHIFVKVPEKPHGPWYGWDSGPIGVFTLAETETETAADKNGLFLNCVECISGWKTQVCIDAVWTQVIGHRFHWRPPGWDAVPLTSTWMGWYWVQHFPPIITAHKRSCGRGYDVAFCQSAWFHVPLGEWGDLLKKWPGTGLLLKVAFCYGLLVERGLLVYPLPLPDTDI